MLLGAGIIGGMPTFSSFLYGSLAMMSESLTAAVVASPYVVISRALGYVAIIVGMRPGGQAQRPIDTVARGEP